jgi:hypothetical protein
VGTLTLDRTGHFCSIYSQVLGGHGGDPTPTNQDLFINVIVGQTTAYDPTTGSGDMPGTVYSGGKCVGASFDNKGATPVASNVLHFVVSDNGNRFDTVLTSLTSTPLPNFYGTANFSTEFHRLNQQNQNQQ